MSLRDVIDPMVAAVAVAADGVSARIGRAIEALRTAPAGRFLIARGTVAAWFPAMPSAARRRHHHDRRVPAAGPSRLRMEQPALLSGPFVPRTGTVAGLFAVQRAA